MKRFNVTSKCKGTWTGIHSTAKIPFLVSHKQPWTANVSCSNFDSLSIRSCNVLQFSIFVPERLTLNEKCKSFFLNISSYNRTECISNIVWFSNQMCLWIFCLCHSVRWRFSARGHPKIQMHTLVVQMKTYWMYPDNSLLYSKLENYLEGDFSRWKTRA